MENLSNSGVAPQYIPLHLIEEFTNNFSDDRKIGSGTYGDVYKGILHNGEAIAVEILRFLLGKDDQKQFEKVVENLIRLRHENIVRLIAYSYEVRYKYIEMGETAPVVHGNNESERKSIMVLTEEVHSALCFEYMQNGSLQKYLYDEPNGLDWPTRYKIIKGTCEALKYLHEGLENPMLHLDLKPDNILLDKNMVPKLADFGLPRLFTEEQTRSLQQISEEGSSSMSGVGTIGYMPPEYIDSYEVSKKFDIFSLGIIIIKIMGGEQAYHECNPMTSRENDIDRVLRNWRSRLRATAAYTTLEEECHQVKTCIETGLDCLHYDPHKRPNIGSIVQRLNETENNMEKLAISLPYHNSRNETGSDAYMIPAQKSLVKVNRQELCFHDSIEPNKNWVSLLQLTNMTDDHIAYMFLVSDKVEYSSTRAKGILSPKSTWEVVLKMNAHSASVLQQDYKVILWSTNVSKDLKPNDITLEMFKQTDRIVDEVKLNVVIEAPASSQLFIQEKVGNQQSHWEPFEVLKKGHESIADPFKKILDVQPLELLFPFQRNKVVPRSVRLTNITGDEHVAFRLIERSGGESGCFLQLPLHGILPPRSTQTLFVTPKKLEEQPQKRDYDLILQTCLLGGIEFGLPFQDQYECDEFFTRVMQRGGLVHEVPMKATQEELSESLSVEAIRDIFYCLDTNPILKWIITGYSSGYIRIGNYETQAQIPLNSFKVSSTAVCAVKFIAREKCFVAGSFDGFLHVYNYETKLSKKKTSWKACCGFITSLVIHPTKPYVLSSGYGDPIKLWNWEAGWECTQTFMDPSARVRQLAFNPMDTNLFASASDDKTIKVWKVDSQFPEYTLYEHFGEVTCLDYFSCDDRQYLISGSNDQTAKIWDLQKKLCVQTLDAFFSPVTCVSAHPNLPVLITGSEDGILRLWNSTSFSLERVLNIASGGDVRGIGYLMGSRRAVIGQCSAISELSIDSMNYPEVSGPCSDLNIAGDDEGRDQAALGDMTCEGSHVPRGDLLEVHPLQLHFPVGPNKLKSCLVHLTNYTNEPVPFMLTMNKMSRGRRPSENDMDYQGCFLCLPQQGVVPPRATNTLVVTTKKLKNTPKKRDINLILESGVVTEKRMGIMQHKFLKAIYGSHEELSSKVAPLLVKVFSVEDNPSKVFSFDTNELKQWIITGHSDGWIRIWNYQTQKLVDSVKVSGGGVNCTKFILRKQWFLVASRDGFICVYNFETKELVIRFKASDGFIASVAIHPTEPYVLSTADGGLINLLNWEECREGRWEFTKTFEGHTSGVNEITFNPVDTNTFASASNDGTVKVWNLASQYPDYTFLGHSGEVNCVNYFACGDKQFLISGSNDHTAKIWDLKEKKFVRTLEAFSSVTSVYSHSKLPVVVTGSNDGSAGQWSSTNFRFQKVLNIGGYGDIKGFAFFMGSRRILIAQSKAVSLLTLDDMEFEEAELVAFNKPQISASIHQGDMTSVEKQPAPRKLLHLEPHQLHFPSKHGKVMVCSLKLTNKTNKQVVFMVTQKGGVNWHGFLELPLCGVVQPRSTYELMVTTKKLDKPPAEGSSDVILQCSALEYENIYPFMKDSEYNHFFSDITEAGKAVHIMTIGVVYGDQQAKATDKIRRKLDELCINGDSISRELEILERGKDAVMLSQQLLKIITYNFSDDLQIGVGGCGAVYKGILRYGTIAVKKLFNSYAIDDKMFHGEVTNMMMAGHQNIVRFLGYCSHTEEQALEIEGKMIMAQIRERLLCFEFISNGSLVDHITDELRGLEWNTRYEIIKGICDGLRHLHVEKHIIHMDLKPANILLDQKMVPKITDFGLSRLDDKTHTTCAERLFTLGYCAPEYLHDSQMSAKSDIYSLGVIILEIVTGSKVRPNNNSKVLRRWKHRGNTSATHTPLPYKEIDKCLDLAERCMHHDPTDRPNISDIVSDLKRTDITEEDMSEATDYHKLEGMLGIEPLEIQLPIELNKQMSFSVELTNNTDNYFAFRFSTTSLRPYHIQPTKDIVAPQSKCCVTVTLQLGKAPSSTDRCKDNFRVQSTMVCASLTKTVIPEAMFNEDMGNVVDTVNLTVVLEV